MNAGVRQIDGTARKGLGDRSPKFGYWLVENSKHLRSAGVHTPTVTYDRETNELVFPWISGINGRRLAPRYHGCIDHWVSIDMKTHSYLTRSLRPLVGLHSIDPRGLSLMALDPWQRIEPRLPKENEECLDAEISWARQVYLMLRAVAADLRMDPPTKGLVPVHGDFHVGQLLFDTPAGDPWMLDLDDIALSVPESDLGNLAAHIVTSKDLFSGDILTGFRHLQSMLCRVYSEQSERRTSDCSIKFYGAVALLRRALKLREQDVRAPSTKDILSAAEDLGRRLEA